MLDRKGGICGGKSGSMHLSDRSCHYVGANSIVGAQLSMATGVAFSEKSKESDRATVVFCGDGALGAGVAYESLMNAQRLGLPLLLVCEDNGWQDTTVSSAVMPHQPVDLLKGLGLPTQEVDGNDVEAVAAAARSALAACRTGQGPQAIVAKTYLRHFHSQLRDMAPHNYRPEEEVAYWLARDPVQIAAEKVRAAGRATGPPRQAAMEVVDRAVAGALAAPVTEPHLAVTAVTVAPWAELDNERWSL
jgi:pyruvate dehydrogenase E1 component alpha subunit/2-oxoisovalerate dehydrogenase E1 component